MKCIGCVYAEWRTTGNKNRLHPSGGGTCSYHVPEPVLPACMYYINRFHVAGGYINRHEELPRDCPHYTREEK